MPNTEGQLLTVELKVPPEDAETLKRAATALRRNGPVARSIRRALTPETNTSGTGADLVDAFRRSPLMDDSVEFERDRQEARIINLE